MPSIELGARVSPSHTDTLLLRKSIIQTDLFDMAVPARALTGHAHMTYTIIRKEYNVPLDSAIRRRSFLAFMIIIVLYRVSVSVCAFFLNFIRHNSKDAGACITTQTTNNPNWSPNCHNCLTLSFTVSHTLDSVCV